MSLEKSRNILEQFKALSPEKQKEIYDAWVKQRFPDAETDSAKYRLFAQQEFGNLESSENTTQHPNRRPVDGVDEHKYFRHHFNQALEKGEVKF